MSSNLHEGITSQIVEALEQGTAPWVRPWSIHLPVNAVSKNPYNGVNILLLWMKTNQQAYKQNTWLTFNQAKDLGGSVKKGEKSTRIIYTATAKKKQSQVSPNEEDESYRFLKSYSVFNINQDQ